MSTLPATVADFHEQYVSATNTYTHLLGVEPGVLTHTREDDSHLSHYHSRLLNFRFLVAPENITMIDAAGFCMGMLTIILYPLLGAHQQVGWWPLAALLGTLLVGTLLLRKMIRQKFSPDLNVLLKARDDSETSHDAFQDAVVEALTNVGLEVLETRPGFRYVTNHGVATIVTINGELDFLINGKIIQQSYGDLYST